VQADIASTGTADSFIKVSHVTRTRHAHQVTAATLYAFLKAAYDEYTSESGSEIQLQWYLEQAKQSIQHLNAQGSVVSPTAPPDFLTVTLFCSWHWSIAIAENFEIVL